MRELRAYCGTLHCFPPADLSKPEQCLLRRIGKVFFFLLEFSSAYALRWNKVIDCRDRIGRVVRLCKWLTVLVHLATGCSRRLLLHEYNVYLLICFIESMVTHSSHNSNKIGMTGLFGESSEGFRSKPYAPFSYRKLSVWPPWVTMLTGEMHDDSSLVDVIIFLLSHYDLSLMLAFK